ncbi:MAG TPA: hypothetical protein VNZ49_04705 [Bacteroidia bacterium]|jgi:hypothetical protein|nr:hypothetical protein [Bacteroidia bacterium]
MAKLSDKLKRIYGAVKLPKKFNEKEELRKDLEDKYLSIKLKNNAVNR